MHRTRNAAYGQPYRGFESLPLRQIYVPECPLASARRFMGPNKMLDHTKTKRPTFRPTSGGG